MRLARGLLAIAVLAPIVAAGFLFAACGGTLFPRCDDPKHPCPPMPEPAPMSVRDLDAGRDG